MFLNSYISLDSPATAGLCRIVLEPALGGVPAVWVLVDALPVPAVVAHSDGMTVR